MANFGLARHQVTNSATVVTSPGTFGPTVSRVGVEATVDLAFHDVVYHASRHRRLLGLWEDLRPQVYVFLCARTYVHTREFREIMIRNHAAILSVIAEGDEERSRKAAAEHVRTSYLRVVADYDAGSEPQGPRLVEE